MDTTTNKEIQNNSNAEKENKNENCNFVKEEKQQQLEPTKNTATTTATTTQTQHHNYIMIQYHTIERYLKNFVHELDERWTSKIQEIRDIIKELYKNPIDLNFSDLNIGIDEESLYSNSGSEKLLNTYSIQELEDYFEKFGIKKQLLERGYNNPKIIVDYSDPFVHRLEIVSNSNNDNDNSKIGKNIASQILVDMFIRRKEFYIYEVLQEKKKHDNINLNTDGNNNNDSTVSVDSLTGPSVNVDPRYVPNFNINNNNGSNNILFEWKDIVHSTEDVLKLIDYPIKSTVIEWLCLQDPSKTFSDARPPLPGQLYPGLGVTKQINDLLVHLATNQYRDCLLNKPFRFYNAFFYQTREYFYVDPGVQAIFLSLLNDIEESITKYGLSPVSWAFEFGCVKEKSTGNIVKWEFHKQIRPISNRMKNYFKSKSYTRSVQDNMRPIGHFYIDWSGHPSLSHFCTDNDNKNSSSSNGSNTTTIGN